MKVVEFIGLLEDIQDIHITAYEVCSFMGFSDRAKTEKYYIDEYFKFIELIKNDEVLKIGD